MLLYVQFRSTLLPEKLMVVNHRIATNSRAAVGSVVTHPDIAVVAIDKHFRPEVYPA